MTTLTIGSGKQVIDITNSAITVFDADTNDPFFLADFQTFRDTNVTSNSSPLAYPLRIRAAAPGWRLEGGRYYGNIPETMDWDNFYEGGAKLGNPSPTKPRFNSALVLPINTPPGILNDLVFGIRDDLSSGYVDGIRLALAQSGFVINRPIAWIGRDDWLEMDDAVRAVTINDGFFENQSVWLSGTGAVSGSVFRANRCIVHQRRWPFRGNTTFFPIFKVWGGSNTPRFEFNDVCIVTGWQSGFEDSSVISALARTQAQSGCRLLVLGGTHQNRSLITAYQNAGFSVLEDGAGTAATTEWLNRKAARLGEGAPVTPPPQRLISPVNCSVQVGP